MFSRSFGPFKSRLKVVFGIMPSTDLQKEPYILLNIFAPAQFYDIDYMGWGGAGNNMDPL